MDGPRPQAADAVRPRRGWSLQIARVGGVPVRIHPTFWIIVVLVALAARSAGRDVLTSVLLVLGVFACVVFHELGHVLVARAFGIGTHDVTLYPIGGISRLKSLGEPAQELAISLAGPAVSLLLAALFAGALLSLGLRFDSEAVLTEEAHPLAWLAFANLVLAAFNLLPAFPMDGGRALRAVLALATGDKTRATRIAARIGQGFAVALGIVGLFFNVILLLIAVFIFLGARAEAGMQSALAAARGHVVRDAMVTRFEVLGPEATLGEAGERLLRTEQEDFPVVEGGRPVGVLTRDRLLAAVADRGRHASVGEVMDADVRTVAPGDDLRRVLEALQQQEGTGPVLVIEDGRLLGMVSRQNLAEFLTLAGATGPPAPRPAS